MSEKIKWGIKSGIAVTVFLISDILFTEIYAFFLMNQNMEERFIRLCYQLGSSFITLLMAFPVFLLVMRIWGKLQTFHLKGTAHLLIKDYLVYAVLAVIPLMLLWGIELFLIQQGQISRENITSLVSEIGIDTFLFQCFLLPIMEEIMFRGILLHKLLPLGTGYAILLSTVFFVMIHYNNPVNMLLSLSMGLVFAHMTVKAEGILPAIGFHIGMNLLGQVILPLCIFF